MESFQSTLVLKHIQETLLKPSPLDKRENIFCSSVNILSFPCLHLQVTGSSIKTCNKSTCPSLLNVQSHNVTEKLISVPFIHSLVLYLPADPHHGPNALIRVSVTDRVSMAADRFISASVLRRWGGALIQPTLIQTSFFHQPIAQPLVSSSYATRGSIR